MTPGGTYGNVSLIVRGVPRFSFAEKVLVFLYEDAAGLHPTGMFQGVWRIPPDDERVSEEALNKPRIAPFPAGEQLAWPSASGGATLVDLEPGPYAVDGEPRDISELVGSFWGGGR